MTWSAFNPQNLLSDPVKLLNNSFVTSDTDTTTETIHPALHPNLNLNRIKISPGSIPYKSNINPQSKSTVITKKSKWTKDEDEILKKMVEKEGTNWSLISRSITGRTGKQCRERWVNQLRPELKQNEWTPQEDAILIQNQQIFGNVWTKIAQFLPGRSPNNVKNRWSWISRHQNIANFYALQNMHQQINFHPQPASTIPNPPLQLRLPQPILVQPQAVKIIIMDPNSISNRS